MKKIDKITALLMALALTLFLCTACAGSGSGDAGQATETAVTEPSSKEARQTEEQTKAEAIAEPMPPQTAASGDIGIDAVRKIVLAKVPGAAASDIRELDSEYDDGRLEYEGSIYYNGYEYEFEVDGVTGNILQWEIDD